MPMKVRTDPETLQPVHDASSVAGQPEMKVIEVDRNGTATVQAIDTPEARAGTGRREAN
jgi:hypothetical protein